MRKSKRSVKIKNFSGSQVALVYPNSDPGMFWVAFYGCLLAEVIPVPIEVPLSRQVNIHTDA